LTKGSLTRRIRNKPSTRTNVEWEHKLSSFLYGLATELDGEGEVSTEEHLTRRIGSMSKQELKYQL
jgi:hypothetical protein